MNLKNMAKRLTLYNVKKAFLYLKRYGVRDFIVRLSERFADAEVDYDKWFRSKELTEEQRERQKARKWEWEPLISVAVPVYRTPETFLRQMIESVAAQTYGNWELCIADGSGDDGEPERIIREYQEKGLPIRYRKMEKNEGIAGNTNAALALAEGDYTALFDHDDLLTENALYEVAEAIERKGRPDMIYSDEDKVSADLSEYFQPHFKPDFSVDLLRANNYICHLLVVSRKLLAKVGGQDAAYDGAQDYDFIFRCAEEAEKIVHIPKVLYHWRIHAASTADNPFGKDYALEAGKRAVEAHLQRSETPAQVSMLNYRGFYRVKYEVSGEPLVSIIIPNKDEADTLKRCLDSIKNISTYRNYEVIIVENNSTQKETFAFYQSIDGKNRVRVVYWKREFNYSAINNFGAAHAKGDYFVLMNNDVTVITPDWIEEFLGHCQRPEAGIVGARLYFPDDTIQHAGIVMGIGGCAGSMFVGMKRAMTGYMHRAVLQQDMSAVTAACLMVKREVFEKVKGLDEKLAVAFNDVDFCMRVRAEGWLVVYDPYVEMYHFESKTRGYEDTEEKKQRFEREKQYLRTRWADFLEEGDPYYNKNLSLKTCDYSL